MRLRFRLRTLLIAIALLSPPLAYATYHWSLAFRKHHAILARRYWYEAQEIRGRAGNLRDYGNAADARRAEELQQQAEAYFRKAHWHEYLSGRSLPSVQL